MYLKNCMNCGDSVNNSGDGVCDCEENQEILEAGFLAVLNDENSGLKSNIESIVNILNGPNPFR